MRRNLLPHKADTQRFRRAGISILVNNNFIISPNPVIDFLTINNVSNSSLVKFPFQITIVNSIGELVLAKSSETLPFKIDLSKFSTGVYFIIISDITQTSYFRAIKI